VKQKAASSSRSRPTSSVMSAPCGWATDDLRPVTAQPSAAGLTRVSNSLGWRPKSSYNRTLAVAAASPPKSPPAACRWASLPQAPRTVAIWNAGTAAQAVPASP
jgi:hypothetical protein